MRKNKRALLFQEPSPAKMAATESSFPSPENAAESGCTRWQEDQQGPGVTPMWTGSERTPTGATEEKHTHTEAFMSISQSQPLPVPSVS